ncbi:pheromone A receptor-domain-containing protein [Hygrophoropsis aurantiaca]|uniref:Pheromone A receptor-domain-containing protein n=1 Tax=Hygrophoropsis aurantiaca TaxID=72124 RepID=A0ACB8AF06_9AGAM|nr:pheromone A receptor-domain-containing protein [Hygrophoropsis aurantiaca]
MHAEIPVLSFICAALVLFPLPWYFRARNIAGLSIGIWLFAVNFILAVDASIWANTTDPIVPVWCDITSSIIIGSHIALPAACLSICIHLERIASFSQSSTSVAKRRRMLFESIMCFALPVVYMALHLIVQPRRFDIFEGFGCRPTTYPSIPTIFLMWIPPLVLSIAAIVYAGIAWRHFLYEKVQFSAEASIVRSPSSLTYGSYVRLIGMAVLEALWSIIVVAVAMRFCLSSGLAPWTSFAEVHKDFAVLFMYGEDAMTPSISFLLSFSWVAVVVQSVTFFLFFISREEVKQWTVECATWIRRRVINHGGNLQEKHMHSSDQAPRPVIPETVLDFGITSSTSSESQCYDPFAKSPLASPVPSRSSSFDFSREKQLEADHIFINSPLESPTAHSVIASSHNSLESNFDPQRLILSSAYWPEPPSTLPVRAPRRSSSMGYLQAMRDNQRSPFEDSAVQLSNPPRTQRFVRTHSRKAIYMTVVKEIHSEA